MQRPTARDALIPVIGALGLVTTPGCGADPMVGRWSATYYAVGGEGTDYPVVWEESLDGIDYTSTYAMYLTLDRERVGSFAFHSTFETVSPDPAESYTESYVDTYDVIAQKLSRGSWAIDVLDPSELSLTCTAERDRMLCSGSELRDDQRQSVQLEWSPVTD